MDFPRTAGFGNGAAGIVEIHSRSGQFDHPGGIPRSVLVHGPPAEEVGECSQEKGASHAGECTSGIGRPSRHECPFQMVLRL